MTIRAQRSPRTISIIIFVALVAISGYALVVTGNFDNPFRIFTQVEQGRGGNPQFNHEAGEQPPAREANNENFQPRNGENVAWSNIGGVLFNIWFLFAVTAFIIVIQYPLRLFARLIKRRTQPVPAG